MPELIRRGYIYIAQPPLYKIKRGNQETYLKDDTALLQYLGNIGIENATLVMGDKTSITGVSLKKFI